MTLLRNNYTGASSPLLLHPQHPTSLAFQVSTGSNSNPLGQGKITNFNPPLPTRQAMLYR